MPFWKRLGFGFGFVFIVPALMPAAAWLGARGGRPDLMACWSGRGTRYLESRYPFNAAISASVSTENR